MFSRLIYFMKFFIVELLRLAAYIELSIVRKRQKKYTNFLVYKYLFVYYALAI